MHKAQSPVTISRFWVLPGGDFTVDYSILVEGGASRSYAVPCPAFLIEHPSALVVFDTGLSPHAIDDPVGYYGEEIALAMKLRFSREQRIDARPAQLGYRPTDVSHVVMSHLHIGCALEIRGGCCEMAHPQPKSTTVASFGCTAIPPFPTFAQNNAAGASDTAYPR
jgi:glyoxylase-like metal-dependent hydrolase (beta-lactamase superfamily II)